MTRIDYKTCIKESEEYLIERLSKLNSKKLYARCEILLWLKSGRVNSMRQAIILKGMNKSQGSAWWKQYEEEGIEGFLQLKYKSRSSRLAGKKELEERLKTDGFASIKEAQNWILSTYAINFTENGLGNYFRKKKIKLKTGRPSHPKKDEQKRETYKKI